MKVMTEKSGKVLGPIGKVTGTFAPKNFRSHERKFHGMEPGAEVPRTFAPRNFRSLEHSLGTFAPWNFRSRKRKY